MVEKTAQELKFKTVTCILALLTAPGVNGQTAMPHVEEESNSEVLSNQPFMVEKTAQDLRFMNVMVIHVVTRIHVLFLMCSQQLQYQVCLKFENLELIH